MAKQSINTIKGWFKQGFKPSQQQFWDVFDSFFHKDSQIPASSIENFQGRLDEKADKDLLDTFIEVVNKKLFVDPIAVSGVEEYTLTWDDDHKNAFGSYGDFRVWQNGSLEQVPIRFTPGDDGKPVSYHFTLSEIDTLIFIK